MPKDITLVSSLKYLNVFEKPLKPFSFFIGGRGIGKTYSTLVNLRNNYYKTGQKFVYLRNTDKQLQLSSKAFGNPFKKINMNAGTDIRLVRVDDQYSEIREFDEDGKEYTLIGYGLALSTFENLRGVDLSDVAYVFFDEFIENRTLMFNQFDNLVSLYETVNRNRELEGMKPLIIIMCSNSQRLNSSILGGFNLITEIERGIAKRRDVGTGDEPVIIRRRHLYLEHLPPGEVSKKKSETALYETIRGTSMESEFINNEFVNDNFSNIRERPLKEYLPQCGFDDFYIWKHKNNGRYYVTRRGFPCDSFDSKNTLLLFRRIWGIPLREAFMRTNIDFSEYLLKCKLMDALNL